MVVCTAANYVFINLDANNENLRHLSLDKAARSEVLK